MRFFITGGSRGIGEQIVLSAIQQGHDVAFTYESNSKAAEAVVEVANSLNTKSKCLSFKMNISQENEIEMVGQQVVDIFDGLDVVVGNAGINKNKLLFSMSNSEWNDVIATNLTGNFYICRFFLPIFLANKSGRYIFISSIAKDGMAGQASYSASKAGLIGLSGTIAKEYGRKGITSNVVIPGFIKTDMTENHMSNRLKDFWIKHCPLNREGSPKEVANTVLFLASKEASFINGQAINVTGGLDWAE